MSAGGCSCLLLLITAGQSSLCYCPTLASAPAICTSAMTQAVGPAGSKQAVPLFNLAGALARRCPSPLLLLTASIQHRDTLTQRQSPETPLHCDLTQHTLLCDTTRYCRHYAAAHQRGAVGFLAVRCQCHPARRPVDICRRFVNNRERKEEFK